MNTEVRTPEQIEELFKSIIEEEEYYDRTELLEVVDEHLYEHYRGARAAMLDALGIPRGRELAAEADEEAVQLAQDRLKRYACDFIKATYLLLGAYGCEGEARDFALMMLAATGGNSKQLIILTDERLSKLTGLSERTIVRRRNAFRAWEQRIKWTVIEMPAQPRKSKQHPPTHYRVLLGDLVSQFIREWRSYYQRQAALPAAPDVEEDRPPELWEDMKREKEQVAFAETTSEETVRRVAVDIMDRNPAQPAPPKQPSQKKPKKDTLDTNEQRILQLVAACRDEARRKGVPAYSWWESFKRKIAILLEEKTPGHPDPADEGDIMSP